MPSRESLRFVVIPATLIAIGCSKGVESRRDTAAAPPAIGGANGALPEMHRLVVEMKGWMTDRQFADMFALAQVTPQRLAERERLEGEPRVLGEGPQHDGGPRLHHVEQPGDDGAPQPVAQDRRDVEKDPACCDRHNGRSHQRIADRDARRPGRRRRDRPDPGDPHRRQRTVDALGDVEAEERTEPATALGHGKQCGDGT